LAPPASGLSSGVDGDEQAALRDLVAGDDLDSATVPDTPTARAFSIFMASRTTRVWPGRTRSRGATWTATTRPEVGA
jgi:hypothetical protein